MSIAAMAYRAIFAGVALLVCAPGAHGRWRTVLGSTGGPCLSGRPDVVTKPFGGGRATVLVRDAGYPDWSR